MNIVIIAISEPIIPTNIPEITNNPSLPRSPKAINIIPIPGTRFVKGKGIIIKSENTKMNSPKILSNIGVTTKDNLGFKTFSTLPIYRDDLCTTTTTIDLLILKLLIDFGNFGASYPNIICAANIISGNANTFGIGGGKGITVAKENIIITNPYPAASIALTKSAIDILSAELWLTTSSIA